MAPPEHESFPQPSDPSTLTWRYMDLAALSALLLGRRLHLTRLDRFDDKFEGTLPKLTRMRIIASLVSASPNFDLQKATEIANHWVGNAAMVRRFLYASCWRLGAYESEAMWRLYCGNSNGLAIVLPYDRLRDSIQVANTTFIGVVKYIDYKRDGFPLENFLTAAMHKRIELTHEQEIRIVQINEAAALNPDTAPLSQFLPWNPSLIEKIVVSPYAQTWYFETLTELVSKLEPGLALRIKPSSMGEGPYQ